MVTKRPKRGPTVKQLQSEAKRAAEHLNEQAITVAYLKIRLRRESKRLWWAKRDVAASNRDLAKAKVKAKTAKAK